MVQLINFYATEVISHIGDELKIKKINCQEKSIHKIIRSSIIVKFWDIEAEAPFSLGIDDSGHGSMVAPKGQLGYLKFGVTIDHLIVLRLEVSYDLHNLGELIVKQMIIMFWRKSKNTRGLKIPRGFLNLCNN